MRRRYVLSLCGCFLLLACGRGRGAVSNQENTGESAGGPYDYGPLVASPTAVVGATASSEVRPTSTPAVSQTAGVSPTVPAVVEVRVVNFAFEPAEVTVTVGTTVVWRNVSPTTHTATAKDGSFDSGLLEGGQTYQFRFAQPGTYEYWCTLHPEMVGTIVVR